ncbi:uncharacterized protein [Hoplias malabaricus]|uniref:uncharacterized protein isoform X2 n=1 Tax=Hoplias malabaricus TaxID=27720 RepID=UPI0034623FC0
MSSCICFSCVIVCQLIALINVAYTAVLPVKVKLHDNVSLPCNESCSGVVRWTFFHQSTDVLAECDQTSCRSLKEGFQMSHDQYLKGDFSLRINNADFSKRARYTCDCDNVDLCDWHLQIEPLNTSHQIISTQPLVLPLDVSEPVEVIYNSTDGATPSRAQICSVDGHILQCKPEYKERVSLSAALEFRGMSPSDSGVYTVRDIVNKEAIHIYTVKVEVPCTDAGLETDTVPRWMFTLSMVLMGALLAVLLISGVVIVQQKKEIQKLRNQRYVTVTTHTNSITMYRRWTWN